LPLAPQPGANMLITVWRRRSREKERVLWRIYGIKVQRWGWGEKDVDSDRAEFVDSTAQKPIWQRFYKIL